MVTPVTSVFMRFNGKNVNTSTTSEIHNPFNFFFSKNGKEVKEKVEERSESFTIKFLFRFRVATYPRQPSVTREIKANSMTLLRRKQMTNVLKGRTSNSWMSLQKRNKWKKANLYSSTHFRYGSPIMTPCKLSLTFERDERRVGFFSGVGGWEKGMRRSKTVCKIPSSVTRLTRVSSLSFHFYNRVKGGRGEREKEKVKEKGKR